jgi:cold shock CspA family protein
VASPRFFVFCTVTRAEEQALAQGQAVTYTTGVGRNGHLAAENVVPSSGGGGGAGGAPKGAAACGKSNRHMEKPTAAAVSEASSMRKEQVPSWEDNMMKLKDRVDPAGVCAAMPTGVVASVKDLEAKGFGFIKPDSGEAASRRARARSTRSLRSCARHVWFLFCTRVAPPQACTSARAHAAACHRPESARTVT